MSKVNVVPLPSFDSADIDPPNYSQIVLHIIRPSPIP